MNVTARSAPHSALAGLIPAIRDLLPQGGTLSGEEWRARHRTVLALLWLHVPVIALYAILRGFGSGHVVLEAGVVALAALLAGWKGPESLGGKGRVRGSIASLGLLTASAVLVHLSGGYIEMHFHFFVMMVVIGLYQDWVPFGLAIGYVALHHGTVGVLDPGSVYNHPDAIAQPWKWAAIPAAFIMGISLAIIAHWRLSEMERERHRHEGTARTQAEAAVRVRDEFLQVAAHELKTPVTSLLGFAELALLELDKPETQKSVPVDRALKIIHQQTGKLAQLLSHLLDASRIEAGKLALDRSVTDVVPLAAQTASLAQARAGGHHIAVRAPASLEARVDPLRLEQVLVNLVDNAIKYSPDGVDIEIDVSEPTPETVRIAVSDHGIGIPPDHRDQIFERFYQAHAEGHYGSWTLHQSPDRRAARRADHRRVPPQRRDALRGRASKRPGATIMAGHILVVEDDPSILELVEYVLSGQGYEVKVASQGAEALEVAWEWQPALILLDMTMPVMNGWEFARTYRQGPGPHAPIVVLTAASVAADRAAEIDAAGFLAKPFRVQDLLQTVAPYLA